MAMPKPHRTLISSPVQRAECLVRAVGEPLELVMAQAFRSSSYRPPELSKEPPESCRDELVAPPQTIISLPVQTAVWPVRATGASLVSIDVHWSRAGL